jgi:hypothetical protein
LSWLKQKKLQKDEILGAFAPKITSFYTTIKKEFVMTCEMSIKKS